MILCQFCVKRYPGDTARIDDGKFVTYPHRIGNNILIYGQRATHFPYQMFIGPEWPCMLFTYALILIPSVFFFKHIAVVWGPGCIIGGLITMSILLGYFTMTACSDPGIIFDTIDDIETNMNTHSHHDYIDCGRCNMKRPSTASHCYDCNLCIQDLDHHCPWTGKCIGKKNLYYFYGFLWAIMMHMVYVIIFVALTVTLK